MMKSDRRKGQGLNIANEAIRVFLTSVAWLLATGIYQKPPDGTFSLHSL
ncbi:hypothetical protein [Legionella feeleii]|nr:hypothetical protein [Legionella feeleii]